MESKLAVMLAAGEQLIAALRAEQAVDLPHGGEWQSANEWVRARAVTHERASSYAELVVSLCDW